MSAGMVATVGLSACGSDSSGAGVSDPVVDLGQLDVGKYSTQPRDLGVPNNEGLARFMEAERLGNAMPLPYDIDPNLKFGVPNTHAFLDTDNSHLSPMFHWLHEQGFADAAKNYISGFSTFSQSDANRVWSYQLVNTGLLFKDENSARDAAAALSQTEFYGDGPVEPAPLDKHPNSVARWQPSSQSLAAWTASGRVVLVTIVSHVENSMIGASDLPFLTALAQKAIDTTTDRLRDYRPNPPDALMTVPVDWDNMRGRALRRPDGDSFENVPGVYDQHGALNFVDNAETAGNLYREFGVDRVAFDGTILVRTRDADAARKMFAKTATPERLSRSADAPKNLPNAKCFQYKGPEPYARFTCYVRYDRFTATAVSQQLLDAQQRISAQYAILASSK
ncbi:DUF7373 family lipoprotein [Nocardia sp. NPDC003482]